MTFLTGFFMALADSVPGVSGGTIAYIMKRYEVLFEHINNIIKLDFKKESISFLTKLGIGWVIGFVSAVFAITAIFEAHIYQISSLFLGFIVISIFIVGKQEKEYLVWNITNTAITIISFLVVIFLVMFQNMQIINLSVDNLSIISYIYIFIVGMVAISAMLLPGISGSAVLVIFGIYFLIIDSVHSFLTFDFSTLPVLLIFGLGVLCGGALAAKTISRLFATKKSQMIHMIIGLLIGSIIAIIYGPTSLENQHLLPLGASTFNILYFIIGIGLISLLEFGISKEKNS